MLNLVEVRTPGGSLLNLPLFETGSGIFIEEIEGLGPVKATLVSSSFAQQDGSQYQSSKRESRFLVLKLDLKPDYIPTTMENLRTQLYNFFMTKSVVNLRFHRIGKPEVDIEGRVEAFDIPLFSPEPQATIAITCFDPDFYDSDLNTFSGETTSGDDDETINYAGNVETGIVFTLFVDRTLAEFAIYHQPPNSSLRSLVFSYPLVSGDELRISTVPGDKGVTLTRGSVVTSPLYGIAPYSNWIELAPGANLFRVHATGASIDYEVEYFTRYGAL